MKSYSDFIEFGSVDGLKDHYEIESALNPRQVRILNKVIDEMQPAYKRAEGDNIILNRASRTSEIGWSDN